MEVLSVGFMSWNRAEECFSFDHEVLAASNYRPGKWPFFKLPFENQILGTK